MPTATRTALVACAAAALLVTVRPVSRAVSASTFSWFLHIYMHLPVLPFVQILGGWEGAELPEVCAALASHSSVSAWQNEDGTATGSCIDMVERRAYGHFVLILLVMAAWCLYNVFHLWTWETALRARDDENWQRMSILMGESQRRRGGEGRLRDKDGKGRLRDRDREDRLRDREGVD